jgi:hypothetical protein
MDIKTCHFIRVVIKTVCIIHGLPPWSAFLTIINTIAHANNEDSEIAEVVKSEKIDLYLHEAVFETIVKTAIKYNIGIDELMVKMLCMGVILMPKSSMENINGVSQ